MKVRMLAPDIDGSEAGRSLVAAMADGIEEIMLDEGIPFTEEGFARVVRMSRASGELGMIGFRTPANQEKLRAVFGMALGIMASRLMPDGAPVPSGAAVRARLADIGIVLGENGAPTAEAEALLGRLTALFGDDVKALLLPFVHGDCQRRLVFEELSRRHPVP